VSPCNVVNGRALGDNCGGDAPLGAQNYPLFAVQALQLGQDLKFISGTDGYDPLVLGVLAGAELCGAKREPTFFMDKHGLAPKESSMGLIPSPALDQNDTWLQEMVPRRP